MPQVSPITVTLNTAPVECKPTGGNGNGSMSYRSADQHVSLVITPKVGDGKKVPDRASGRMNLRFDVADHLDPTVTVEREVFLRFDVTLPPERDVDIAQVVEAAVAFLNSSQVAGVLNGESFW